MGPFTKISNTGIGSRKKTELFQTMLSLKILQEIQRGVLRFRGGACTEIVAEATSD